MDVAWLQLHVLTTPEGSVWAEVTDGQRNVRGGGRWFTAKAADAVLGRGSAELAERLRIVSAELLDGGALGEVAPWTGRAFRGVLGPLFLFVAPDHRAADFPWERLFRDPVGPGGSAPGERLRVLRVVRDAAGEPVGEPLPHRVLVVAPTETDLADDLCDQVLAPLERRGVVQVTRLYGAAAAGPDRVASQVRALRPHVLHVIAHGRVDAGGHRLSFGGDVSMATADLAAHVEGLVGAVYLQSCEGANAGDDVLKGSASAPATHRAGAELLARSCDVVLAHHDVVDQRRAHAVAARVYAAAYAGAAAPGPGAEMVVPPSLRFAVAAHVAREVGQAPLVLYARGELLGPRDRRGRTLAVCAAEDEVVARALLGRAAWLGVGVALIVARDGDTVPVATLVGEADELHLFWSASAERRALGLARGASRTYLHLLDRTARPDVPGAIVLSARSRPSGWVRAGAILGVCGAGLLAGLGLPWAPALAVGLVGLLAWRHLARPSPERAQQWSYLERLLAWLPRAPVRAWIAELESLSTRVLGPAEPPPSLSRAARAAWYLRRPAVWVLCACQLPTLGAVLRYVRDAEGGAAERLSLVVTWALPAAVALGLSVAVAQRAHAAARRAVRDWLAVEGRPRGPAVARTGVSLLVACLVALNPVLLGYLWIQSGDPLAWVEVLGARAGALLRFEVDPARVFLVDRFGTLAYAALTTALFAALPALLLGGLMLASLVSPGSGWGERAALAGPAAVRRWGGVWWLTQRVFLAGALAAVVLPLVLPEPAAPAQVPAAHAWAAVLPAGEARVGEAQDQASSTRDTSLRVREGTPSNPTRTVTTGAYQLGATEVTQAWWRCVWDEAPAVAAAWGLRRSPSPYAGDTRPVSGIGWCDAARFTNLWSLVEGRAPYYADPTGDFGLAGCEQGQVERRPGADGYRLPTDEEWERAARAGAGPVPPLGGEDADAWVEGRGWHARNAGYLPRPVGAFGPDALGHVDLAGNVEEWVDTWWAKVASYGNRGGGVGDRPHFLHPGVVSWEGLAGDVFQGLRVLRPAGEGPALPPVSRCGTYNQQE